MGVHLGWGLVIPRCDPEVVRKAFSAKKKMRVMVEGPLVVTVDGQTCDFAFIERWEPARKNPFTGEKIPPRWAARDSLLHPELAAKGFELGTLDAPIRALSAALGDVPIAFLTAESTTDTYTLGVLRAGKWRGAVSAGDSPDGCHVAVSEKGKRRVVQDRKEAKALDDEARALAALWQPREKHRDPRGKSIPLSRFGIVDGIMMVEWFGIGDPHEELYRVEDGVLTLAAKKKAKKKAR